MTKENTMKARTQQEQSAYENACDCLYYGYGQKHWNNCELAEKEAQSIWQEARRDMAR